MSGYSTKGVVGSSGLKRNVASDELVSVLKKVYPSSAKGAIAHSLIQEDIEIDISNIEGQEYLFSLRNKEVSYIRSSSKTIKEKFIHDKAFYGVDGDRVGYSSWNYFIFYPNGEPGRYSYPLAVHFTKCRNGRYEYTVKGRRSTIPGFSEWARSLRSRG